MKAILQASDIERFENTGFATVVGVGGFDAGPTEGLVCIDSIACPITTIVTRLVATDGPECVVFTNNITMDACSTSLLASDCCGGA